MPSITLTGTLIDNGGELCICGFQWGLTIAYGQTTATQVLTTGNILTETLTPADGLLANTGYHYQAFATNSISTSYGLDNTFVTPPGGGGWPPIPNLTSVVTLPATFIVDMRASLNGLLINDDGFPCDVWFEYGTTNSYGQKTPTQSGITSGNTFFDGIMVGEGKAIHYRAAAQNSEGIVYGADMSFSSLSYLGPVTVANMEDLTIGEG